MATSEFNYVTSHGISRKRIETRLRKDRKRRRKSIELGILFCDHCRKLGHSMPFCYKLDFCDLCGTPGHNPLRCRTFSIRNWNMMAQYLNRCEECFNPLVNDMNKCAVCGRGRKYYSGSHKKQSSQTESFKMEQISQTTSEDTKVENIVNKILDERIPNDSENSNILIGTNSIVSPTVLTYFNDLHEKTMQQIKILSHDVQQNKLDLESRLLGLDSGLSSVNTLTISNLIKTGHLSSQIENISVQNALLLSKIQCSDYQKTIKFLQDKIIQSDILFTEKDALTKQQTSEIDELNCIILGLNKQLRNTTVIHQNDLSQLHSVSTQKEDAFKRIKKVNLKLYEKNQHFLYIQREREKLLLENKKLNSQISSQELFRKKFPLSEFNDSLQNDAYIDSAESKLELSKAHETRINSLASKLSSLEKHVNQNTLKIQHQNNIKNVIFRLEQDFRFPKNLKANIENNCYLSNPRFLCDNGNEYEQSLVSSLSSCSENPGFLDSSYEIDPLKQFKNVEREIQDQLTVNKNKDCGFALKLGDTVALLKDYQSFRPHTRIKFKSCNEYDHLNYYNCNGNFYREI